MSFSQTPSPNANEGPIFFRRQVQAGLFMQEVCDFRRTLEYFCSYANSLNIALGYTRSCQCSHMFEGVCKKFIMIVFETRICKM